jgi:putative heme-binding domain-containing protein
MMLCRRFIRRPSGANRSPGIALALIAISCALWAWPSAALAQRQLKDIPDPDPEIERQTFTVADGFEVNLFAADPVLAKPIQISFDADGRLWVASSETYPQVKPGQQPDDKILVLEDADGDGRADKTTIFARGLLIPTGIEPGDGGAYVANSTELVFLKDTNGDGQADQRRVLLSGFGTEDTHHMLHTFRWGPEGLLYFNQSHYIHSNIETPYGVRRHAAGGFWRFRPETFELDIFAEGLVNCWGHAFDRWGQSFATDGAGGEGINFLFPGARLFNAVDKRQVLSGLNPGSPKESGLEIVDGRPLPDDWQGSLVTNDFRAHRVCRHVLSEDGAGFASREQPELIKSTHVAFRPIDVKQGPDGAIYIADWYNPIIQHGEVDFRDERRDHTHGRIWRVSVKGKKPIPRPHLSDATPEQLCSYLAAPESWTRQFAKRVLKETGESVLPDLADWLSALDDREPNYEHNLLEGLWTYQGLNEVDPDLLARVLKAKDPHARAAAVRVLGAWHARLPDALKPLRTLVADEHPRVRLEAVCALTRIGTPEAVQIAMQAVDQPTDRFLDHALFLAASTTQAAWLPALEQHQIDFDGNVRHLAFALQAADSTEAVAPLAALIRSGKLPAEYQFQSLSILLSKGGPTEFGLVFEQAITAAASDVQLAARLLSAVAHSSHDRKLRPVGDLARLGPLLSSDDSNLQMAAAQAAGLLKVESLRPRLIELAKAVSTPERVRGSAIEALADLGGASNREVLIELAGAQQPAPTRVGAIAALIPLDMPEAASLASGLLAQPPDGFDPRELLAAFIARGKPGADALTTALKEQKVPSDIAALAARVVRASPVSYPELVAVLQSARGVKTGPTKLSPDEMQKWVEEVVGTADPARGQIAFRRASCLKCHAIAGAGGLVGPDLVSIGAAAQIDYLIASILDPSDKIKENYHSLLVTTDDGLVYSGIKLRESGSELVLRDAEDREIAIPTGSIEERKEGQSLMPLGAADSLTHAELIDLVRFLSELGKVGPYAVDKSRVVRRWQVLLNTPESFLTVKQNDASLVLASDALPWTAAYSQVAGSLPAADIPVFRLFNGTNRGLVRFQLDVTTPGRVDLKLSGKGVLSLWVDGVAQSLADPVPLDLATGIHTLMLVVDPALVESLRAELVDVPDSKIQIQIVGGK